jgi:hypothetical protein
MRYAGSGISTAAQQIKVRLPGGCMRIFTVLSSILLLSAMGFAQDGERSIPGYCPYGCGPYVPMITTPSLSLTTYSPHPVGATNATGGLFAGATNSTLSEINGETDAVYTVPVWYSGGGMPLVSPATNSVVGSMKLNGARPEYREHMEREKREREATMQAWVYFASGEPRSLGAASAATGVKPTKRTYTNQDVQQQNDKNGYVHYDSKTEKIQ